jgi:hypothetical protein
VKNPKVIRSGKQTPVGRNAILQLMSALFLPATLLAQIPDHNYDPPVPKPAYAPSSGPVLAIDEAHNNSHTGSTGFAPFAKLLRKDGYRVEAFTNTFSAESLQKLDVLVIVNAQAETQWTNIASLPTLSAFQKSEIDAVEEWVKNGGALLLVAGHMPWPGAAERLAERFDVIFHNGFSAPRDPASGEPAKQWKGPPCRLALDHPIFAGRSPDESIRSIVTAWGTQAFRFRPGGRARPLLLLEGECFLLLPVLSWRFPEATPRIRADGMPTGATVTVGKGRVVLFGVNAAWLTAQLDDGKPWGMNQQNAKHNAQFVLNVMHWLTKLLPDE